MAPTDDTTTITDIKHLLRAFAQARDWEQFHTPKDLGVALVIEVAEVLEHFRFLDNNQIRAELSSKEAQEHLAAELADVFYFLVRLSDVLSIDLCTALDRKIQELESKYPAHLVRGKPFKYDRYNA